MVSDITPAGILNAVSVSKVKKTKRTERKGFGDAVEDSSFDGQKPASAQSPLDVGSIGALFNTINTQRHSDQKNVEYGHALLDKLEQLRLGIVAGEVPKSVLLDLQHMLSSSKEQVSDGKLQSILLDIEARVAVELAKLNI